MNESSEPRARPRSSLTVGRRLFLALVPALLAVLLAAGLAYYGEFARQAPRLMVFGAATLSVVSLAVTWANTRYLTDRIARLSGRAAGARTTQNAGETGESSRDELDNIEHSFDRLGSALSASEAERQRAAATAASRLHDEATMLAATAADAMARLDDVRLPLHILLDARFGELNENQEELLRDARGAADAMDARLRSLAQLADADRGELLVQRELVQVNDVVRSVLPLARAGAQRRSARVAATLEPGLPRLYADRARLAQALALLIADAVEACGSERPLTIATERAGRGAVITISPLATLPAERASSDGGRILGRRLIEAQNGRLSADQDRLRIVLGADAQS